jgi:hypothetical protein
MLKAKDGRKGVGEGKSRGRRKGAVPAAAGSVSPDLWEILGRFDQALSLVVVAHRSLAAKESAEVGDEEEALRQGIRLLKEVHKELDRGAMRIKGPSTARQSHPASA